MKPCACKPNGTLCAEGVKLWAEYSAAQVARHGTWWAVVQNPGGTPDPAAHVASRIALRRWLDAEDAFNKHIQELVISEARRPRGKGVKAA